MTIRLAVDIGGTFTDLVLQQGPRLHAAKVLTTHGAPESGVLAGVAQLTERSGIALSQVELLLHGTTLATNALIERRGARTALLTTEGHRDVLAMAFEHRFEQYDVYIDRPEPLVPRAWRVPIPERTTADGRIHQALDEASVRRAVETLQAESVESVAVGFLHAYRNPVHERRVGELLSELWPEVAVSLSSDVCPEIREYERLSTTCANAYVQPLMAGYLGRLETALTDRGLSCPILLMTSGGGLTDVQTARRFPIRLVESGPAGGARLAAWLAEVFETPGVLSFDMGGTTAKLCLIDHATPMTSRAFEVDRVYRFKRGSGLPVRIPVVEMVEIGAGGGSIASVDALQRIRVGPTSAGSEPGPALYGRGGAQPTVTDADAVLGRSALAAFSAAGLTVDLAAAQSAIEMHLGAPLEIATTAAAHGISEVVAENMAAASRAHAAEWGLGLDGRTLIAFGGAAPLHAVRLADGLGIRRVLIPAYAGVGSALGFLLAPVSYEVVRSARTLLSELATDDVERIVAELKGEAVSVVEAAAQGAPVHCTVEAYMRYAGQGYEIAVAMPEGMSFGSTGELRQALRDAFDARYTRLYGRVIDGLDLEILSWTLTAATSAPSVELAPEGSATTPGGTGERGRPERTQVFASARGEFVEAHRWARSDLPLDCPLAGPVLIDEAHTTSVVPAGWSVRTEGDGHLWIERDTSTVASA
ncbi:MAG: hydantoinase/oxoprolinase family protein [Pseudomonadota bacterium]